MYKITDELLFKSIFEYYFYIIFHKNKTFFVTSPVFIRYKYLDNLMFDKFGNFNKNYNNSLEFNNIDINLLINEDFINKIKSNNFKKTYKLLFFLKYNNLNSFYSYNDFFVSSLLTFIESENNNEKYEQKIKLLYNNVNLYDNDLKFYIYWASFYLFPYKLISLDDLNKNFIFIYNIKINQDNPFLLLDYSRVLGIQLYSFSGDKKYIFDSIKYIYKSISILKYSNNYVYGYIYSWLGIAYRYLGDLDNCIKFIDIGIFLNTKETLIYELPYYWKLSILYQKGFILDAINYGNELLDNKKIFNNYEVVRIYKILGYIYIDNNNKNQAFTYIKKSLEILIKEYGTLEIMDNGKAYYINLDNSIEYNIDFIYKKYKILIKEGGVHFVELFGLEKLCYEYTDKFIIKH